MRDALVAALTLDTFNRHAEKIDMANIAQLVNCLQSLFLADGDKFVTTPNFHVFEMYRPHQNATAVRLNVQAPNVSFRTDDGSKSLFSVAGSASRSQDRLTMTLVHTHASEPASVLVELKGGSARDIKQTELAHEKLDAHNTFDRPDEVVPRPTKPAEARGAAFEVRLLPASVTRLDVMLG
jgi:alpha-N-arabinofuranosidase